ncbi:hypothetical protein H0H93_008992 [Arthromyces matolae]|nr:hypothetical protein H0H93_008992 [Arthromyces matolae]
MKFISVVFLIISLSTLSVIATPLKKMNVASPMTTEDDFLDGIFGPTSLSDLVEIASNDIHPGIGPSTARAFSEDLTKIAQHLQDVGAHGLPKKDAQYIEPFLSKWRTEVADRPAAIQHEQSTAILAAIATCRNIAQEALAPSQSHLPGTLYPIIERLEQALPAQHEGKAATDLAALGKQLRGTVISKYAAQMINDKLLTFNDWVQNWSYQAKTKRDSLEKIGECQGIMRRKL